MGSATSRQIYQQTEKAYNEQDKRTQSISGEHGTFLHQFKTEVGEQFFREAPTVDLLRRSQEVFRQQKYPVLGRDGLALPYPTSTTREEMIKMVDCASIDDKVLQVEPDICFKDLSEIVTLITVSCKADLEKVRAVFRWIASQNPDRLELSGSVKDTTAAFYLSAIKKGTCTYAKLFEGMCRHANIPCKTIRGWVKGTGYEPGQTFEKPNGEWSAVLVGGAWRLVDCHWCLDTIADGKPSNLPNECAPVQKITEVSRAPLFDDFFFLVDPWAMISSHCPEEASWQLLARPVSLEEFQNLMILEPSFFQMGFCTVTPTSGVVQTQGGTATISFNMPAQGKFEFSSRLSLSNDSQRTRTEQMEKLQLDRFTFLNIDQAKRKVNVVLRSPCRGEFMLEVFCADVEHRSKVYERLVVCKIVCDKTSECTKPYPRNSRCEWGPGVDLAACGATPVSHQSGLVNADGKPVEFRFRLQDKVEFRHKLLGGISDETFDCFAFYEIQKDLLIYRVHLPECGEFALKLYARKLGNGEKDFVSVCSYLIQSDSPLQSKPIPFPESVTRTHAGPTDDFTHFGMKNCGPQSAFRLSRNGEVDFKFKLPKTICLKTKVGRLPEERDFSEHVNWKVKGDTAVVHIEFTMTGLYQVVVCAKLNDTKEEFKPVFHGLVNVTVPKHGALPFPKTLDGWKPSYEAMQPLYGYLPKNKVVPFLVHIPDAKSVSATGSSGIELTKNRSGFWAGSLLTGNEGAIQISATFKISPEKRIPMLCYKVL